MSDCNINKPQVHLRTLAGTHGHSLDVLVLKMLSQPDINECKKPQANEVEIYQEDQCQDLEVDHKKHDFHKWKLFRDCAEESADTVRKLPAFHNMSTECKVHQLLPVITKKEMIARLIALIEI